MLYSKKQKEKIFKDINENGYAYLKNVYTNKQLDKVKSSLLSMLNYINPEKKRKSLQEKYYQIKKISPILKGHFYELCKNELEILKLVNDEKIVDLVKGFFKTDVIFSAQPGILVYDDENDRCLVPHQETHQFAKDFLFVWSPLYDAKGDQGGLLIYEKSHKHGYYKHHTNNQLGSTNVNDDALKKFKPKKLEVKAGDALLIHSALIHGSVETKKKYFSRFIIIDRLCPLKKLPYLEKENVPKKIPYFGHGEGGDTVDYNTKNIYLNDSNNRKN
tara:strand:- start:599 stop:1420 length:822 start_codon:yes stop_codon:yes gene_type:complete